MGQPADPRLTDDPWLDRLHRLLARASYEAIAFDVFSLHAAWHLRHKEPLPDSLARFAADVLAGTQGRPPMRGRQHASLARNRLLCAIIDELHQEYGIAPTRNDATEARDSGCDILADALRRQRMTPSSYAALKRIWLNRPPED